MTRQESAVVAGELQPAKIDAPLLAVPEELRRLPDVLGEPQAAPEVAAVPRGMKPKAPSEARPSAASTPFSRRA
jgi:hypothetical protein